MDHDMATIIAGIVIATIGSLASWAAARTASNASTSNKEVESRTDMEKDAYERARVFDTETIERQDKEIVALREENKSQALEMRALARENEDLHREIRNLLDRVARLEADKPRRTNE